MKKVVIIGLGYVGLPLALLAKEKGLDVVGYDVSASAIANAKSKGIEATDDSLTLGDTDYYVICVPTPVDKHFMPDLCHVVDASKVISKHLKTGQTIIIESTIYPGVTEEVVLPILEKSGLKCETDFYLAHCPERIDPGNKKWDVRNLPRVLGGIGKESVEKAAELYENIVDAEILKLTSIRAAEATKIMENSFRDINIAFVNEMAKSFDQIGVDILEVIKAATTKPFGFMPHYPGCGVGGHCIPVDPYYLIEQAKQKGFNHRFLMLAREINNDMPQYTVERVIQGLNELSLSVNGTKICVLGVAYKPDIEDIRGSPALEIIKALTAFGADVKVYDPFVPKHSTCKNLIEAVNCDCIILCTEHSEFKQISGMELSSVKVVIDGRNFLNRDSISSKGIVYKGIGRN